MSQKQTNAYGELNPLYPIYHDKEEELNELMRFFQFSYQQSSGYTGTAVFEIVDNEKTYIMSINAHPDNGVDTSRCIPRDEDISFHCTLPYTTFHNVFWGYTTARTLVMGGGCKIKHWAYRAAYNFGISFDMSSNKWLEYYKSGQSIKKMVGSSDENDTSLQTTNTFGESNEGYMASIESVNASNKTIRMNGLGMGVNDRLIGGELPKCAEDTDFMYEWEPQLSDNDVSEGDNEMIRMDIFGMVDMWRNKQRNMIKMNNNKHISLWHNSIGCSLIFLGDNKYVRQMERYRENLTFNPVVFGRGLVEKWKSKIKKGGLMIMEEYYGFYSEYTRNKIGTVSLKLINSNIGKFTSLVRNQTTENEVVHFSLLNSMF